MCAVIAAQTKRTSEVKFRGFLYSERILIMKAKINRKREPIMLTSEDSFDFQCTQCGKCCRNREDVLLTGPDIYRVSKDLDMKPNDFIKAYCEIYIGDTSRVPICRLKPLGTDKHCPLLTSNQCRVHQAKPTVCALFPLARVWDKNGEAQYYVNAVHGHTGGKRYKISEWLERCNLPVNDEAGKLWNEMLMFCVSFMLENEKQMEPDVKQQMWNMMLQIMYLSYHHEISLVELMRAFCDSIKDTLPRYYRMLTHPEMDDGEGKE